MCKIVSLLHGQNMHFICIWTNITSNNQQLMARWLSRNIHNEFSPMFISYEAYNFLAFLHKLVNFDKDLL